MSKPALGRGLGALLGGTTPAKASPVPIAQPQTPPPPPPPATAGGEAVRLLAIELVVPCPFQPRKDFSDESLRELADSIREQGIVQPLIARPREGGYELIAGERRWRAAQIAGLKSVPVILREADDRAVLEMALIENLQRENLNPIEEALGYEQLVRQFQLKQDDAAQKVGKSRAVVANALRLLKLPLDVRDEIRRGSLSVGHAKVLLALAGEQDQSKAAALVLKERLSVRQTEELVAQWQRHKSAPAAGKPPVAPLSRDPHVVSLEDRLRERFGARVSLKYKEGRGALEIRFTSNDELDRILAVAGVSPD